jgi:hypothetical protein
MKALQPDEAERGGIWKQLAFQHGLQQRRKNGGGLKPRPESKSSQAEEQVED